MGFLFTLSKPILRFLSIFKVAASGVWTGQIGQSQIFRVFIGQHWPPFSHTIMASRREVTLGFRPAVVDKKKYLDTLF